DAGDDAPRRACDGEPAVARRRLRELGEVLARRLVVGAVGERGLQAQARLDLLPEDEVGGAQVRPRRAVRGDAAEDRSEAAPRVGGAACLEVIAGAQEAVLGGGDLTRRYLRVLGDDGALVASHEATRQAAPAGARLAARAPQVLDEGEVCEARAAGSLGA